MMTHHFLRSLRLLLPGSIVLVLRACVQGQPPKAEIVPKFSSIKPSPRSTEQSKTLSTKLLNTNFMIFGGEGAPSYNEIAIEKNIFYFQRTLKVLSPKENWNDRTNIWFANGNDRMAEMCFNAKLAALDSDFLIYRRDRNAIIPIVIP